MKKSVIAIIAAVSALVLGGVFALYKVSKHAE